MKQLAGKRRNSKKRKPPVRKEKESVVEIHGEIPADSSGIALPSQYSTRVPENAASVSGAVPVTTTLLLLVKSIMNL